MLGIYTPGQYLETFMAKAAANYSGGKNMLSQLQRHYETTGKPRRIDQRLRFGSAGTTEHQLFRVNGAGETILGKWQELLTDDPA